MASEAGNHEISAQESILAAVESRRIDIQAQVDAARTDMASHRLQSCLSLNAAGGQLQQLFERFGVKTDLDQAIQLHSTALENLPEDANGHSRLMIINDMARLSLLRAARYGALSDSMDCLKRNVALVAGIKEVNAAMLLNQIGVVLENFLNSRALQAVDDLLPVIAICEQLLGSFASPVSPKSSPIELTLLCLLADLHLRLYNASGTVGRLDRSVKYFEQLFAKLPPQHYYQRAASPNMVSACIKSLLQSQAIKDAYKRGEATMDALLQAARRARSVQPHLLARADAADVATALAVEAELIETILDQEGRQDMSELETAVDLITRSVKMTKQTDTNYEVRRRQLGRLLVMQFHSQKHLGRDVVPQIRNILAAVPGTVHTPWSLDREVATILHTMAFQTHGQNRKFLLIEAKAMYASIQASAQCTSIDRRDHAIVCVYLSKLSVDDAGVLNEAIEDMSALVDSLTAPVSSDYSYFSTLSNLLAERHETYGMIEDLHRAIDYARKALAFALEDQKANLRMNLSRKLGLRSRLMGIREDIIDAIAEAEASLSPDDPETSSELMQLNNLAERLREAYEIDSSSRIFLERAIKVGKRVQMLLDKRHKTAENAAYYSNLGISLFRRAEGAMKQKNEAAAKADLLTSIVLTQRSHELLIKLGSDQSQAVTANNLAIRFQMLATIDSTDRDQLLKQATDFSRLSVSKTEPSDPKRCRRIRVLIEILRECGPVVHHDEICDRGLEAFYLKTAPADERLLMAQGLTRPLAEANRFEELELVLREAIDLGAQLQLRALRRNDQERRTKYMFNLAVGAASAILQNGNPTSEALMQLEKGRGYIWNSLVTDRTELKALRECAPHLHDQYCAAQAEINANKGPATVTDLKDSAMRAEKRVNATRNLEKVMEQIRQNGPPNLFSNSTTTEDLSAASKGGIVVTLVCSVIRADAIILDERNGCRSVALPSLTHGEARAQAEKLRIRLRQAVTDPALGVRRANRALKDHLAWLWKTIVWPIVQYLGLERSSDVSKLPRIWWYGCDVLSQFPIHAAGNYQKGEIVSTADYCISSYIFSIRALQRARGLARRAEHKVVQTLAQDQKMLVVTIPETPDGEFARLDTESELGGIREAIPTFEEMAETPSHPMQAQILQALQNAIIAHFACHGILDPRSPSRSRLILHDHARAPLTVAQIEALQLSRALLAYLSACHTAENASLVHIDEGISLANAFQLAGFPSVVGTLWQAFDTAAVNMSRYFYENLWADCDAGAAWLTTCQTGQSGDKIARALHAALLKLRSTQLDDPIAWASWIHVGN